ncbi:PLP-dependent aminotransferase family protein [Sinorhizobium sp. 8-89]|uniref:MocR-like pyridoxine biosynthesis transcription factor PdxR n=1 Tax=Sinorhizobium sp. 7-81 TaxID=3049087 RepID=UPI0024C33228|nr:PLP-dependent aminotransferase family protein [Sinorhizobium sp. 7-81]MDK1386503.1 PLP-dependent aminotransferase family protein [Sinorhizobium sp. 7-81]
MQLPIVLERGCSTSLQTQLINQLREFITLDRLKPGSKLPGTRALSDQLRISRNTVLIAYDSLEVEGYLKTLENIGTFVVGKGPDLALKVPDVSNFERPLPSAVRDAAGRSILNTTLTNRPEICYDFELESSDPDLFPAAAWRRLMNRHMRASRFSLTADASPLGYGPLRSVICDFLAASRAMRISPEQVIVVTGIQQALSIIGHVFVSEQTPVVIEAPGCAATGSLFRGYGAKTFSVPIDRDGLLVRSMPDVRNAVVFTTPARQFPLGASLKEHRRTELLTWAEETSSLIIEADYDSDFSYDGSPAPALHALDQSEAVIHAGSFATSLGSGLRVGYMVVPTRLIDAVGKAATLFNHGFPCHGAAWIEQSILAEFIASGAFDKHLRMVRKAYLERRDTLISELARHFGVLDLAGISSGTHVVWRVPHALGNAEAIRRAGLSGGVAVHTLDDETIAGAETLPDWQRYLLLGYAAIKPPKITAAVELLAARLLAPAPSQSAVPAL